MQLESLRMFCDVVETGSFSRAAQLNHVTQSAVSQQVRALETRYEQRLLSRSARAVTPTPAGERLFRGCKEVLSRFTELEQEIREAASEVSGACTISAIHSVGLHELRNIQIELLKFQPKVKLRLNYRRSDQVYDEVILGAADMGLVAYPQGRAGIEVLPFREEKLVAVFAPSHPLAPRQKVTMSAVAACPFIAFDRDTPTRRAIDKLFHDKGLDLTCSMEVDNVETIKRAAELGLGVCILPLQAVKPELALGTLVARPFADAAFTRPVGILLRKGKYLTRAAQAVLDAFKKVGGED